MTSQRLDRAIDHISSLRTGDDWAALLSRIARHPKIDLEAVLADTSHAAQAALTASALSTGPPAGLWDALAWLARRHGFTVARAACDVAASATDWSSRRICVSPDAGHADAGQLLLHELGHVLLHGAAGHRQNASTAGCRGIHKLEADSVAFIVLTRIGMDTARYSWPYISSWAGSDPRARPEATVLATVTDAAEAAGTIIDHLDVVLFGRPPSRTVPSAPPQPNDPLTAPGMAASSQSMDQFSQVLRAAEQFYLQCRDQSWVPRYLASRGLTEDDIRRWRIGYAPAQWTALIDHLRALGHGDDLIEAAGLARRSSRGTLIDHFRDRVMLTIRQEHGAIAGFIGRASPAARPEVPKYLNTPDTATYVKGNLLFGLYENRCQLADGAVPVLVEGPFDAIAVTSADRGRYAGLAPCGTALTARQVAALTRLTGTKDRLVLVALDGDRAGRDAAVRAYGLLSAITTRTAAVLLPEDRDPADILQADGRTALAAALRQRTEPLARVVIDAHLDHRSAQLRHAEGQLNALRDLASVIASGLPAEVVQEIAAITGGQPIRTIDERMQPIAHPELARIAVALPAGPICQIVRIAERFGIECSEVTAAVANAALRGSSETSPDLDQGVRIAVKSVPARPTAHASHNKQGVERGPPPSRAKSVPSSRPARRSPR